MRFHGPFPRGRSPLRARWIPAGFVLGLAAVSCPLGVAAQCDDDKIQKATPGGSGYHQIDATLCEGIYGRDVSGAVLTLVGFTEPMYFETYDPLKIRWSAPAGVVYLRAQSWAEQAFQMDARIADATALEWPVDLLQSESIPLSLVGLLGWVEAGGKQLYVPLRVSQGPEPERDTEYVFLILPNARIRQVRVTLASVGAAGERPSGGYVRNDEVIPQTRFTVAEAFEVPILRSELPSPGVYFMEISATQVGNSTPDTVILWFYHAG